MGASKHNPIARLAKAGKLPPKKQTLGKRETERIAELAVLRLMLRGMTR